MMKEFIHLHTHSEYSCLSSLNTMQGLMQKCSVYGMPGIALADIGNMYGCMEFFLAAQRHNDQNTHKINPIVGIDIFFSPQPLKKNVSQLPFDFAIKTPKGLYRFPLLAENEKGYENLCKLSTLSFFSDSDVPWIDFDALERHKEGIIVLSGGNAGVVFQLLKYEKEEEAIAFCGRFRDIFQSNQTDGFFIELQDNKDENDRRITKKLIALGKKLSLPFVATNEVYYLDRGDWEGHEVIMAIRDRCTMDMPRGFARDKRPRMVGSDYHFKSVAEMDENFGHIDGALKNTLRINERCRIQIVDKEIHMPNFFNIGKENKQKDKVGDAFEKEQNARFVLEKKVRQGFEKLKKESIGSDSLQVYEDRIKEEIKFIDQMGYCDYFLIVSDLIDATRAKGILVGPGRGSVVGSLVSYALGITAVDPIRYGLLFERFLNPERVSLPDIDIDFQDDRRDEVIEYVQNKYGKEQICQIIAFSKLKSKAVFKDVCRVYGVDFKLANETSSFILTQVSPDIKKKEANAEPKTLLRLSYQYLHEFRNTIDRSEQLKKVYEHSLMLENLTRQPSIHAAGVVIADRPLQGYIPLAINDGKTVVSQYDGRFLESQCGLLKMDFLGLKTLTLLKNILQDVEKQKNISVDINHLPLQDKATYDLFAEGKTMGIFQFESDGMTRYLSQLKPENLEELIAMNALFRPGPMNWIPVYIARKKNENPVFSNDEDKKKYLQLEDLCKREEGIHSTLKSTRLIPIYQEQIMQLSSAFAGFNSAEADNVRQAIGKKKKDLIDKIRHDFVNRSVALGRKKKDAIFLYDEVITSFGSYGFNKSHAASYAFLAFQVAYLKAHYPISFFSCLLNSEINNLSTTVKFKKIHRECMSFDVSIDLPNINESGVLFYCKNQSIVFGLEAIKSVGQKAARSIVQEREKNGYFSDFADFLSRLLEKEKEGSIVNKQVVESLIKAGCFDQLGDYVLESDQLLSCCQEITDRVEREISFKKGGQISFFESSSSHENNEKYDDIYKKEQHEISNLKDKKDQEIEALGFSFRYDFALRSDKRFRREEEKSKTQAPKGSIPKAGLIEKFHVVVSKKNQKKMAIFTLNDGRESIDIFCFENTWELLQKEELDFQGKMILIYVLPLKKKKSMENSISWHFEKFKYLKEEEKEEKEEATVATVANSQKKLIVDEKKAIFIYIDASAYYAREQLMKVKKIVEKFPGKYKSFFCDDRGIVKKNKNKTSPDLSDFPSFFLGKNLLVDLQNDDFFKELQSLNFVKSVKKKILKDEIMKQISK